MEPIRKKGDGADGKDGKNQYGKNKDDKSKARNTEYGALRARATNTKIAPCQT